MPGDGEDGAAGGGAIPKKGRDPKFVADINSLERKWIAASTEVKAIARMGREALSNPLKVIEFCGMFRSLEKYFSKCENLMESIEDMYAAADLLDEFTSGRRPEHQRSIKSYYYEALTAYENITQKQAAAQAHPGTSTSANMTFGERSLGTSSTLPRISLPKFDGKYSNWPKFRDTFSSIVEKNPALSTMEKFHYLSSSLTGNAATVIGTFSLEEKNYVLAWRALESVYENKRLLANAYLTQLLQYKPHQGKPNVQTLLGFLSNVADNISALKLLNIAELAEFILFFLAFRCLDSQTKEQFELANKGVDFPTFDSLIKYVREKCLALQLTEGSFEFESNNTSANSKDTRGKPSKPSKVKTTLVSSEAKKEVQKPPTSSEDKSNTKCVLCPTVSHSLLNCTVFYSLSPEERLRRIKNWSGCKNCLNSFHSTDNCRSKWHCRFCPQRHHALLHQTSTTSTPAPSNSSPQNSRSPNTSLHTATSNERDEIEVILGTAWVNFLDSRGRYQRVRVILDSGSCSSFMTTKCLHKLGLSMKPTKRHISSLGGSLFDGAKGKVSCTLRSSNNADEFSTEAIVVKNITNHLPVTPVPYDIWRHYVDLDLADPKFWEPAPIEFLLGADLYGDIMKGDVRTIRDDLPKLFDSAFGLVVMGKYTYRSNSVTSPNLLSACLFSFTAADNVAFDLANFWETEEPSSSRPIGSPDDEQAELHFRQTHYRTETGRYVVRLPFLKENIEFPSSRAIAKHRLLNLESKLKANPKLSTHYHQFMRDYLDLGHMKLTNDKSKYVIPHHSVSKIDRGELKIRVVFDASARSTPGSSQGSTALDSLNGILRVGPRLQNDIRDILLNFRAHAIVFVTDAVKCYRQILVDPADRPYQHILWRFDPTEAIQTYELNTVTYGLCCSPFLSLRVLQALTTDDGDKFPKAADVIRRDIYIDDLATGANTLDETLELQRQVIELMRRGGFELGKWASNRPEILAAVNATTDGASEISWHEKENVSIKVLGLKWEQDGDCFSYQFSMPPSVISKRGILSTIARIYDPLGFVCPFVFYMKQFIQELWKLKVEWDDEIPHDLSTQWAELIRHVDVLSNIKIPRFVTTEHHFSYRIVGFCDASQRGYCAALYIRVESDIGIFTHLLTAKSKLAPMKTTTIPRLELCGAYLLTTLYKSIGGFRSILTAPAQPPKYFTDSMIVMGWLQTPTYKLQTFVGNRIAYILEHTNADNWSHVNGVDNPSDLGSRGCLPQELLTHDMWWHGPTWLCQPESEWPVHPYAKNTELCELKPQASSVLIVVRPHLEACIKWMERVSSYERLIRIVGTLNRGMEAFKTKSSPPVRPATNEEYLSAEFSCIKAVQNFYFFDGKEPELSKLQRKFSSLNPYIDADGVVRVGGRLNKSTLPDSHKHPILLPQEAHFTRIMVDSYHVKNHHPGPNLQQALIQLRFWVPSLRRLIRHQTFKCLQCFKSRAKFTVPIMADLPTYRLHGGRSFLHVGCDFAGPFSVKESHRRKSPVSKVYLCLYVCMTTKALHLELVSNLTSEAFLASFSRFTSRRGLPSDVYSDCGTNFKGAARELQELAKWFTEEQTKNDLELFGAPKGIKWHFNPPYSPHFGGLWEAGVKSVKRHLYLTAGQAVLTMEELQTLFCKVEALLNSRPLCPLSTDPGEIDYLSPAHFLVGGNLLEPPEPTLLDVQQDRLARWQIVKQISERIWQRWRLEYLATLQARTKWRKPCDNLQIGDLVLIKTNDAPQLRWPVGRVIDVHPGTDGVVRVVTLRTSSGTYQRSAANLIPLLPLNEASSPNPSTLS